jgi:hypothetical protein
VCELERERALLAQFIRTGKFFRTFQGELWVILGYFANDIYIYTYIHTYRLCGLVVRVPDYNIQRCRVRFSALPEFLKVVVLEPASVV